MRNAIAGCAILLSVGVVMAQTTTTAPATSKASVEEQLREQLTAPSTAPAIAPLPAATVTSGEMPKLGAVEPVSGTEPKVKSVQEGTILVKRVVRITKDEKSGNYLISFDSDGKVMADPPMIGLPCKSLADMEDAQAKSSQPIRFQITGEVTEYKGRNYILIQTALRLRDLNGGLGGG
jgi:hypothetical protein